MEPITGFRKNHKKGTVLERSVMGNGVFHRVLQAQLGTHFSEFQTSNTSMTSMVKSIALSDNLGHYNSLVKVSYQTVTSSAFQRVTFWHHQNSIDMVKLFAIALFVNRLNVSLIKMKTSHKL